VYRYIEEYEARNQKSRGWTRSPRREPVARGRAAGAGFARPARSFSEPVSQDGSLTLGDTLGEDTTGAIDDRLTVDALLQKLSDKERAIVLRRYFARHMQSEIARDYGMTQVQVSRLESKIIARLRREAAGEGGDYSTSRSGGKSSVAK
jgi:RNA polymerase sigma factor (sigma-70 family)